MTILGSAVFAALLSVTVYIMVCGCIGKTASIFGYSVLKVVSGSMEPSIHEGDYIYIKRTDTDSLKAGDIISFYSQDDSIKGEINTHRISEVLSDGTFVTKGDANKIEDSVTVQKVSIIGKYYGKLRFFKWLGSFASTKKLLILFVIIPTVCMAVYEVKTIAEIKIYSNREEALKAAEEEKEKLMREALNQEKIMKAKMITAIVICIAALAGLFVFIGLYMDKSEEVRKTYIAKYMENLSSASEEIDTYLESGKDLPTRYNMILSDMGAARSLVFLIDDYTDEQKAINELHYCFVKYPEQMQGKLEDVKKALDHITENLDKGYREVNEIVDSVDKMGN